ncbi:MAG: cytochrome C oxidase subunit IV family protein [Acidobacteria bacterium]|nr:cytochrome C oxidase subunit IV family protein [Acidobacteriota bacterium]
MVNDVTHADVEYGGTERPKHLVPLRVYFAVFAALMTLTALTVFAAMQDLGPFNTVVALVIACTKAVLVVLYFMHVRYSTKLTWAVIAGGVFWLLLLLLMTLSDYITRGPGWLHFG